ncbi:MAG: N-acetyltransferase [Frankiales bacterium]|nr:N-acetyltransferase [Frankiales bacterium]
MSDVAIRTARPADALAVESIRIGTWRTAYRGIVPDDVLDALTVEEGRRAELLADPSSTTLLAERAGMAIGMAVCGPARDDDRAGTHELYALYVVPQAWGAGVGSALLARCPDASSLWVLEQNTRARDFYVRHGFTPDGESKVLDLGGPVVEIRMLLG